MTRIVSLFDRLIHILCYSKFICQSQLIKIALSLKVGDEFGNFDDLKKQIKVYSAITYVMCSIPAIPVMCSTPAQSTPSLLKELYHLLYSLKELYLLSALHAQRALPAQRVLPAQSTPSLLEELYDLLYSLRELYLLSALHA